MCHTRNRIGWAVRLVVIGVLTLGPAQHVVHAQTSGCALAGEGVRKAVIVDHPEVCLDCISFVPRVFLGEEEGSGRIEVEPASALIDELGRYWVLSLGTIRVYSPEGEFLKVFGGEEEGIGEFPQPTSMSKDTAGWVYVFDAQTERVTRLAPDLSVRQEFPIPGAVNRAGLLQDGGRYVANMLVLTPDRIGNSIHIVELAGGRILQSFALAPEGGRLLTPYNFAVHRQGFIYAAEFENYVIRVWSDDGDEVACLERPDSWEPRPPYLRPREPGQMPDLYGFVVAAHLDDQALLWISSWVPREEWHEGMLRIDQPNRPPSWRRGAPSSVYRNIVEIIDVERARVLARAEVGEDPFVTGFLGGGLVFGTVHSGGGALRVAVSNVRLTTHTKGGR